jgi:hypothetical protein
VQEAEKEIPLLFFMPRPNAAKKGVFYEEAKSGGYISNQFRFFTKKGGKMV